MRYNIVYSSHGSLEKIIKRKKIIPYKLFPYEKLVKGKWYYDNRFNNIFKIVEVFQHGCRGFHVHGFFQPTWTDFLCRRTKQKQAKIAERASVADTVSHGDVLVDYVVDKFFQHVGIVCLEKCRESALLDVALQ